MRFEGREDGVWIKAEVPGWYLKVHAWWRAVQVAGFGERSPLTGHIGVWSFDTNNMQLIPGLDPNYGIGGWTLDGSSVYASPGEIGRKSAKVYQVNTTTGKMVFWREFGMRLSGGIANIGMPRFSRDADAYAYVYARLLSQAYLQED